MIYWSFRILIHHVVKRNFFPFHTQPPELLFKVGEKLEVIDPRNQTLCRVATVNRAEDFKLQIHFDGWPSLYDYWFDFDSTDIHPIGWCQKTGHDLEPPPSKSTFITYNRLQVDIKSTQLNYDNFYEKSKHKHKHKLLEDEILSTIYFIIHEKNSHIIDSINSINHLSNLVAQWNQCTKFCPSYRDI